MLTHSIDTYTIARVLHSYLCFRLVAEVEEAEKKKKAITKHNDQKQQFLGSLDTKIQQIYKVSLNLTVS